MNQKRQIMFEGYTADEILAMSDGDLNQFVFIGEPLVFLVGSAQILGEFRIIDKSLVIELAQIDGGGEGILHSLWLITKLFAMRKGLLQIEWIVHAINCAKPNLKLRRVLIKRGFEIRDIEGIGEAYYYRLNLEFSGLTLLIPDKPDLERDAVAKSWEDHGGSVVRIDRFWEPPKLEGANIRLYGNHIFCMVLAQKLNLELISPPDDLIMHIAEKWLKREVRVTTIAECEQIDYPCFIKPLVPKIFAAGKFRSYSELLEECKQLNENTPVIISSIVEISSEVRSFILNRNVCATSIYEGEADINDAKGFLNEFILSNRDAIPKTCVVDIGYINKIGWAVIEANAVWGAGLNGCDPLSAARCIAEATKGLSQW